MEELVKVLTKQNERLIAQVEQNKILKEQLVYLTQKLFGTSSEKTPNDSQLSLFEAPEV